MNGFKRRRKALEKKSERMRDAKGVRASARDAQTLTPRAGGRVRALRARGTTPEGGRRAAGARDARERRDKRQALGVRRVGLPRCGDKSSEPRLNLSGSWQQGHSAAYNTPFLIQVVCK